jgi:hypothetical protein
VGMDLRRIVEGGHGPSLAAPVTKPGADGQAQVTGA